MRFLKKSNNYIILNPIADDKKPANPSESTLIYNADYNALQMYRTITTDASGSTSTGWYWVSKKYDGSSEGHAALSGYQLIGDYPNTPSGYYWIQSEDMPDPLQMFVDVNEDGGGYDFYAFDGTGTSVNYVTSENSGIAKGLDLVMPRSKYHWRAMSYFVKYVLGKTGSSYEAFFQTAYGIHSTTGGDQTSNIMRDPTWYGTGCAAYEVKDGGRWWLRDTTYSEPNGDYTANALLGIEAWTVNFPEPYALTDLEFNDSDATYATGTSYLVSTNAKP